MCIVNLSVKNNALDNYSSRLREISTVPYKYSKNKKNFLITERIEGLSSRFGQMFPTIVCRKLKIDSELLMDNAIVDVDLIESEDSEDEDNDLELTMEESVPFKEKVEKWLTNYCNGTQPNKRVQDSETVVQQKTVVVTVDETESTHSVDTEQYIKSNRRKTTTKITTTTIKKYYSVVEVAEGAYQRIEDSRQPIPTIRDVATNVQEKDPCNAIRRSPRKASNNLPISSSEVTDLRTKRKKRIHNNRQECDTKNLNDCSNLDQIPLIAENNCNDQRTKNARKCRTPYNTRLSDEPEAEQTNRISVGTSKAFNTKGKQRRTVVSKKRKSASAKGRQVKLRPPNKCTDLTGDSSSIKPTKRIASATKLQIGPVQSAVQNYNASSDSEQDDILLTSYKPFSLVP